MLIRMVGYGPAEAMPAAETVETLRFPERLCLWTLRVWMFNVAPDGAHRPLLAEAYAKLGASGAMASIDAALWTLRVGGHRPLRAGCPCHESLFEDEMRILHLLACEQIGAPPARRPVLEVLLAPAAARAFGPPLACWAAALERAGLRLPLRDWPLAELTPDPAPRGRGGAMLH